MPRTTQPMLRIVDEKRPPSHEGIAGSASESPDIVFIVDPESVILYVSRSLPSLAQDDVLGTSLVDYIHPDQRDLTRTAVRNVFVTGQPGEFEAQGMTGDTSTFWYDCRVVPTKRDGRVVSASVIARDVTMRKHVEGSLRTRLAVVEEALELKAAEARELNQQLENARDAIAGHASESMRREFRYSRFREIIDACGEAVFVVDRETDRVVDANGTACRWLSRDRADLLEKTESELALEFPVTVPNDADAHVAETRDVPRAQYFSGQHRRTDGTVFPVEVAVTLHAFGEQQYVLAMVRDARVRQSMEHRLFEMEDGYRALFELSRDAIYLSNRDGTIAEVNDAAALLFGYPRNQFEGIEARSLFADAEQIRAFQKDIANHGFVRDIRVDFMKASGELFVGLLTATFRRSGRRQVLGYQVVVRELPSSVDNPVPRSRADLEAAEARGRSAVLLIDEQRSEREEARGVLELGGLRVLVAESLAEGLLIFRARASEVGVIVLAGTASRVSDDQAFGEIRQIGPGTRVVFLGDEPEQAVVENLAAAGLAGIVRRPFHPIGLIQTVREALAAHAPPEPSAPVPIVQPRYSRVMTTGPAPQHRPDDRVRTPEPPYYPRRRPPDP